MVLFSQPKFHYTEHAACAADSACSVLLFAKSIQSHINKMIFFPVKTFENLKQIYRVGCRLWSVTGAPYLYSFADIFHRLLYSIIPIFSKALCAYVFTHSIASSYTIAYGGYTMMDPMFLLRSQTYTDTPIWTNFSREKYTFATCARVFAYYICPHHDILWKYSIQHLDEGTTQSAFVNSRIFDLAR